MFATVTLMSNDADAVLYRYIDKTGAWRFSNKRLNSKYKKWVVGHEKWLVDDQDVRPIGAGVYDDYFIAAGTMVNLEPAILKAMAAQESGFNPRAVSPKGAMGMMQLMPATALELGVDDPFDAEQSISGGARYLRGLVDSLGGDLTLAIAAYNCGERAVRRSMAIPHIEETQDYVRRVLKFYAGYSGRALDAENKETQRESGQAPP